MDTLIKTVNVTDGIILKVKDKNGLLIADRIVSAAKETSFVDEHDRQGTKQKKEVNREG